MAAFSLSVIRTKFKQILVYDYYCFSAFRVFFPVFILNKTNLFEFHQQ